jgi:serine/threonine protein kinase
VTSFVRRVLYLLGLLSTRGIVHGAWHALRADSHDANLCRARVGDIKLTNFVLDTGGVLRMIDFGGCAWDRRSQPALAEPAVTRGDIRAQTRKYSPLEFQDALPTMPVTSSVDIYACGMMFDELSGRGPWRESGGIRNCGCFLVLPCAVDSRDRVQAMPC